MNYPTKILLGFIGGFVGTVLAGIGCTAFDRACHYRRVHKKAIRDAKLNAAVQRHPAGTQVVSSEVETSAYVRRAS